MSCSAEWRSLSKEGALLNCILNCLNVMNLFALVSSECCWSCIFYIHVCFHLFFKLFCLLVHSFLFTYGCTAALKSTPGVTLCPLALLRGGRGGTTRPNVAVLQLAAGQTYSMLNPWTQRRALNQPSSHDINQPSCWISYARAALCTSKSFMSLICFSVFCFAIIGNV